MRMKIFIMSVMAALLSSVVVISAVAIAVEAYHFDLFRPEEKLLILGQHSKYRHFDHRVHVGDYPAYLLENYPDIYHFTFPYYRYLSSFGRDGNLPYVWKGGS